MSEQIKQRKAFFKKNIKKINKLLKESAKHSCLILASAPTHSNSGGESRFRQNSDFYYTLGSEIKESFLFFSNKSKEPVLIAPNSSANLEVWYGKQDLPEKLSRDYELDCLLYSGDTALNELSKLVKGHNLLYIDAHTNSQTELLVSHLHKEAAFNPHFPREINSAGKLVAQARVIKESYEIRQIKKALSITNQALEQAQELIIPGVYEYEVLAELDYSIKMQQSSPAFPYIIASGPNAAVLHYFGSDRKLRDKDFLLIDCGASYNYYNSDISRTYPVGNKANPVYQEIYDIVLAAQTAVIRKCRPGADFRKLFQSCCKDLCAGLKELGVLKGSLKQLMAKKAYQPYFMHSLGHSLGLDVHDPSSHRDHKSGILQPGMVVTIEPGLYFSKKTQNIPAGGVRIEDNILITKDGSENLSTSIKK